jgi:hypothetical protein
MVSECCCCCEFSEAFWAVYLSAANAFIALNVLYEIWIKLIFGGEKAAKIKLVDRE